MNQDFFLLVGNTDLARNFGGASTLACIQLGQHFLVSDGGDYSIKMFDLEGKFISKFGKQGNKDEEFNYPRSLLVNKERLLMVCDCNNHRVQVFRSRGTFFTKFRSNGSEKGNLTEVSKFCNKS